MRYVVLPLGLCYLLLWWVLCFEMLLRSGFFQQLSSGPGRQSNEEVDDFDIPRVRPSNNTTPDRKQQQQQGGNKKQKHWGIQKERVHWLAEKAKYPESMSQEGQDIFVDQYVFGGKRGGFYIEAGALDGKEISNTYLFQRKRGWDGLLVEPTPNFIPEIRKNRGGAHEPFIYHGCLTVGGPKKMMFRPGEGLGKIDAGPRPGQSRDTNDTVSVTCDTLTHILTQEPINDRTHVDFFSLDVEGHEMQVLHAIDYTKIRIDVLLIESHPPKALDSKRIPSMIREFQAFLHPRGYRVAASLPAGCLWGKDCIDLLFVRDDFLGPAGFPLPVDDPFAKMDPRLRIAAMQAQNPYSMSQEGQDLFIDEHIFGGKRGGFYVEAGALDGKKLSNTYLLQRKRGWSGLLVEPTPNFIPQIKINRGAGRSGGFVEHEPFVYNGCLTADGPKNMTFRPDLGRHGGLGRLEEDRDPTLRSDKAPVTVMCDTLSHVLSQQPIFSGSTDIHVDFFSLDVEGHEMKVLRAIDFSKIRIDVLLIDSLPSGALSPMQDTILPLSEILSMIREFQNFLQPHGYHVAASLPDGCIWGKDCMDLLFVRDDFTGPSGSPLPEDDPFGKMHPHLISYIRNNPVRPLGEAQKK